MAAITTSSSIHSPLPVLSQNSENNSLVKRIIACKEQAMQTQKEKRCELSAEGFFSELSLISGDLSGFGYFALMTLIAVHLVAGNVLWGRILLTAASLTAGPLDIGVAFVCYKEYKQAKINGNDKLANRLLMDFLGLLGAGAALTLAGIAPYAALSHNHTVSNLFEKIHNFFNKNSIAISAFSFMMTLPLAYEVGNQVFSIFSDKRISSKFASDTEDFYKIANDPPDTLSTKFETLQSETGVKAALAIFKHIQAKQQNEDATKARELADKEIQRWNRIQSVRLLQQVLYITGFLLNVLQFIPGCNILGLLISSLICLAGANFIPLILDIFYPFERNTLLVVPKVEPQQLNNRSE